MGKSKFFLFLLIMAIAFAAAGCGDNRTASEILREGLKKNGEITSATYSGTLELNLELPQELFSQFSPDALIFYELLKNAKVEYRGAFQTDPYLAEIILSMDVHIGDLQTRITLPLLTDEQNLWVKVPNIPGIPELEPIAGKYIQFNVEELSAFTGEKVPPIADLPLQQQFSQELTDVFFKHFDDTYFSKLNIKDVNLPEQTEAQNAVQFQITPENFGAFVMTILDKVGPEAIDVMNKPEYQGLTHMTPETASQAKAELAKAKGELENGMAELNKTVQITKGAFVSVLDKQDYIRQQSIDVGFTVTPPDLPGPVKIGVKLVQNVDKINQAPAFENTVPPADGDVIPLPDLFQPMMNH